MGKDELDFHKFDPKFTNKYEPIGPEWGELHKRREEWINENRGKWKLTPYVPNNIEGLVPL